MQTLFVEIGPVFFEKFELGCISEATYPFFLHKIAATYIRPPPTEKKGGGRASPVRNYKNRSRTIPAHQMTDSHIFHTNWTKTLAVRPMKKYVSSPKSPKRGWRRLLYKFKKLFWHIYRISQELDKTSSRTDKTTPNFFNADSYSHRLETYAEEIRLDLKKKLTEYGTA